LLLQGPGRGITLSDGTLVFPAQFKTDTGVKALDGGQYTCHSTIVFSKDGGKTWHIGTGAKSNTTEAQVVQLKDGSLMINMRDDRNRTDKGPTNGRAVAVTRDLGVTWSVHPSSNSALPEPNCMASLIAAEVNVNGAMKKVLLFSNPDDKNSRTHITVKASFDEGLTWPRDMQLELYGPECFGYSCLTMIDQNTLGILYEGTKEILFQRITLNSLFEKK
jgi:sialidase-1